MRSRGFIFGRVECSVERERACDVALAVMGCCMEAPTRVPAAVQLMPLAVQHMLDVAASAKRGLHWNMGWNR